ncbi:MAG: hypothetical protein V3U02_09705 [Calditrichia bacterium]
MSCSRWHEPGQPDESPGVRLLTGLVGGRHEAVIRDRTRRKPRGLHHGS